MQYANPVDCLESCKNVPCHLTCKEHTSLQKLNISAEVKGRWCYSPNIPPASHMSIKDIKPLSDAKGQTLLVGIKLQPLSTQKRAVDQGSTAPLLCNGLAGSFCTSATFQAAQITKNLQVTAEQWGPFTYSADGNPGVKSKHRFTWICWLTDIIVSPQRYRNTS